MSGTSWRKGILAADVVFGLILLLLGLAGGFPVPTPSIGAPPAPPSGAVEVTSRFGEAAPPGQSTGLAVASDGSLAVVDRGRQIVIRLNSNGRRVAEWGPRFGPDLQAKDLVGIAPDGDGWFVLDRGAQRILRLDANGQAESRRTIDLEPLATYGPNGLATDRQGNLYLVDTGRNRIVVFDSSGHMTTEFGDGGTELGKFKQPMGVAFGADSSVFISDWENSRIQRWDADRRPSTAWPVQPHAWGITVDALNRVYVPDGDHHAVRIFGPDGTLLATIGGPPSPPIPIEFPSQVAVSPDGSQLWVLGSDGLARVDLAPYANLRPPPVVVRVGPQSARTPLALLGGGLIVLAAIAVIASPSGRDRAVARVRVPTEMAQRAPKEPSPLDEASPRGRGRGSAVVGLALFASGAIAAVVAAVSVADPVAKNDPWPRMAWLVGAGLVCGIGAVLSNRGWPWRWVSATWPSWTATSESTAPSLALLMAAISVGLGALAAVIWWQGRFQTPEATHGALVWLAAVLFAVATIVSATRAQVSMPMARPSPWLLVPVALFVIALVPRAWNNAELPFGVWFDEAEAGLQARRLLGEGRFTPITDTYGRDASAVYYLIAVSQTFIKDPVVAGRLVAAMFGALCAPLMYFLGRELFGWQVGAIAGLVIATSRWHLNVSRLGWDPISLPLASILAFWLLARVIRTARWTDALLAGLALGAGLHAYIGFRSLPIVAAVLLIYAAWVRHWSPVTALGRFGLLGVGAVLTALPVIIFAIQEPAAFNGRFTQTLILNESVSDAQKLEELWSNLQKHALMFHVSGDMNGRHNLPGAPMLDTVSGLLMLIGLGVLIARPFDWRSLLLLGWAVASMAGGVFTFPFEAPQAMRTLGVTPVLSLLVALALVVVLDRVRTIIPTRSVLAGACMAVLGGIGAAWIGYTNLDTFFTRQMNDPIVWGSFSTRETIPSRAALEAPRPYEAILGSPTIAPTLQQQLLVPEIERSIRGFDAVTDLPYRGDGPTLFVLETEHDAGLADEIARYYPEAARQPIFPPNGALPLVDELVLQPDVVAAHRGMQAIYRGADGASLERHEPSALVVADSVPLTLPVDVSMRALLALDMPGAYAFRVPNGFRLTVDGARSGGTGADRLQLARGNHVLTVDGTMSLGSRLSLEWLTPGVADWQPVDSRRLFIAPPGGSGLQATFYPTAVFNGSPTESIIDPILDHYYHLSPLSRVNTSAQQWSVEWSGELEAPTTGTYRFEAERLSRAGLWIDDQRIFDDTADDAETNNSGVIQLTGGRHEIRVRLQNRGDGGPRLYLYWSPPGGAREILSGQVLYPPPPRLTSGS